MVTHSPLWITSASDYRCSRKAICTSLQLQSYVELPATEARAGAPHSCDRLAEPSSSPTHISLLLHSYAAYTQLEQHAKPSTRLSQPTAPPSATLQDAASMSSPGKLADNQVYLGQFLLERLTQLGVKRLFGVPGDVSALRLSTASGKSKAPRLTSFPSSTFAAPPMNAPL